MENSKNKKKKQNRKFVRPVRRIVKKKRKTQNKNETLVLHIEREIIFILR